MTKDKAQVALRPLRHWTDSKIRCHIFTCIAALALLRIIELRLRKSGLDMTAKTAMRMLEEPDEDQADIMRPFGWEIVGGVLQEI